MTKYTVFFATCTPSMDTINVYLGLFSVHYQLKLISRPIHTFTQKYSRIPQNTNNIQILKDCH
jgi:hypothetical protein